MAGAGNRTLSNTDRRNDNDAARVRRRRGLQQPQWPDSHPSRGDGGMQLIASNNNGHTADITAILRARKMRRGAKELQVGEREREREASGFSRLLAARHSAGARRTKARGLRAASERESERSSSKQANHRVRGAWWGICRTHTEREGERYPHNRV